MEMVFFDNIDKLGRIVLTTFMVYVLIVLVTKASGKRSTSQLNNFDWIVTVMIGSLGASTILLKRHPFYWRGVIDTRTVSLTVFDNQIRLYLTAI